MDLDFKDRTFSFLKLKKKKLRRKIFFLSFILFFLILFLLYRDQSAFKSIRKAEEQTAAKRQGMSYEDIVIQDPKSVKIPFAAVEKYEVKKGVLSGGADFAGTIKGSIKPTILWVNGKKNMVFLTKEDQEKMEQILMSRCPGRIK